MCVCVCEGVHVCHVIILCPCNKCFNPGALCAVCTWECVCVRHKSLRVLSSFCCPTLARRQLPDARPYTNVCTLPFSCHLAIVFRHFLRGVACQLWDPARPLSVCKCGLSPAPLRPAVSFAIWASCRQLKCCYSIADNLYHHYKFCARWQIDSAALSVRPSVSLSVRLSVTLAYG